ncbi:hypothetical protein ACFLS9_03775 [Bacteroidota bacterium]
MKKLFVVLLFLFYSASICQNAFYELNTSRYARVVSLGNAFTGLADDIEAVYYNSAGLANLDYYSFTYSKGNGFAFVIEDYISDNFALLLPTFQKIGKFAFSVDRQKFDDIDMGYNLFRLHYARSILANFALGTSLNYYYFSASSYSTVSNPSGVYEDLNGNAFDMSISALYNLLFDSLPMISNQTRFGVQLQNVFDTDLHYTNDLDSAPKHQSLRFGISTSITPKIKKIYNLTPFKIIGIFDAVFYGSRYKFDRWQPNFGIELVLFDIVSLRYGRENEEVITETYSYSPQHPVKRYGVGLSIPLDKFLSTYDRIELSVDYSYSDWDKLDETKPMINFFSNDLPKRESLGIKLSFNL